jgi:acyl-CoA oxidase
MATTETEPLLAVDPVELRRHLDGDQALVREHVRAVLARPEFARPASPPPTDEYRARVSEWTRTFASTGGPALLFPEEFGGLGRVADAIASFEVLGHGDLSLLVKCGVQFGLFGGAVHHLGSRAHHERYLEAIASFELPGCFAMSETGHGSNVQRVGTTATYDPEAGEFVLETPTDEDRKDYIGNAARDAWRPLPAGRGPQRRRRGRGRGPDRGLRREARPERSRQRAPLLRPRVGPAGEPARPLRAGEPRGRV